MQAKETKSARLLHVFDWRMKLATVLLFIGYVATILFTGGIVVCTGKTFDRFTTSEKLTGPGYFPMHSYVWYDRQSYMILPFLLYWEKLDFPAGLNVSRTDITYLKRHEPYRYYIVDRMEIAYTDGETVALIDPDLPQDQRTFEVDEKAGDFIFHKAIKRKESFVLHISGQSVDRYGRVASFEFTKDFKIQRLFEWTTVWEIYASC
jgi:hypothetical protein